MKMYICELCTTGVNRRELMWKVVDFEAIKRAGEQDFIRNTVFKGKNAIINGLIVRRSLKTGEKQALTLRVC